MAQERRKLPKFPSKVEKQLDNIMATAKKLGYGVEIVDCGDTGGDDPAVIKEINIVIHDMDEFHAMVDKCGGIATVRTYTFGDGHCIGQVDIMTLDNKVDGHFYASHNDSYVGDGNTLKWVEKYAG